MSSHRMYERLRRYMPSSLAADLDRVFDYFIHSTYRRDLGGIRSSVNELGLVIRRFGLPRSLVDRIIQEWTVEMRRAVYRKELPTGLYDDITRLLRSEIGLEAEIPSKPRRVKEERKRILEAKFKEVSKIAVGTEMPVLFFLGAGASKPSPSNIPVISELLDELWKKSEKMENKPLAKLETWCKENKINNIEEMLTGVTLSDFMIRNRKVHNLLNSVLYSEWSSLKELTIRDVESVSSFQNMIDTFFSLLVGTMLGAQPNSIHEAIADFIKQHENVSLVKTNYDVCMDQALDNSKIPYSYVIGSHNGSGLKPLVKMHGSINWFYCQTCQHVLMPTVGNMRNAVKNDVPYSVTGMCPVCTAPAKQFIVPPTTYKYLIYPPIVEVWNAGREIFEKSRIYVIIGYSFSLADDYISKMLLKAIREDPSKQLIIIDKSSETIERFKSYVTMHTVNFNMENFHDFTGPAEEIAPNVIRALKGVEKRKAKKKESKKVNTDKIAQS